MRKLLAVLVVVGVVLSSGACMAAQHDNEYPASAIVYGLVDGGLRYEKIVIRCTKKNPSLLSCTFDSSHIRLSKKTAPPRPIASERAKAEADFFSMCPKIADAFKSSPPATPYSEEVASLFARLCSRQIDFDNFLDSMESLETNQCSVSAKTWDADFVRRDKDTYEYSGVSELFITGIKKAVVHTLRRDKSSPSSLAQWNLAIEASYMGKAHDGTPNPAPYKDEYSWHKPDPALLPCKYVTLDLF